MASFCSQGNGDGGILLLGAQRMMWFRVIVSPFAPGIVNKGNKGACIMHAEWWGGRKRDDCTS